MTAEVILMLDRLLRIGQLRAHCLRSALKRERHGERLLGQNLIGTPNTNFSNMVTYRYASAASASRIRRERYRERLLGQHRSRAER